MLVKSQTENKWLLTGWEDNETATSADGAVRDASNATTAAPIRTRHSGDVAVSKNSIAQTSRESNISEEKNPDAVDWNGNREEPETRRSAAEEEDESLSEDWFGSRKEDGEQSKTPADTETDAPHSSPAATPSTPQGTGPEGEGSSGQVARATEDGGQVARATDEAQALAREKKVSIAEKASIEGLKSRIESAEKRLGAYKILQQEGMMTDEIRAQMRDVQESLVFF